MLNKEELTKEQYKELLVAGRLGKLHYIPETGMYLDPVSLIEVPKADVLAVSQKDIMAW